MTCQLIYSKWNYLHVNGQAFYNDQAEIDYEE